MQGVYFWRVAACFLVQNADDYVKKNVSTLHRLISNVAALSTSTPWKTTVRTHHSVLHSLKSGVIHNIDSLVLDGLHSTKLCRRPLDSYNCPARVKRLAFLRQRASTPPKSTEYDYVLVDLDFVHLPEAVIDLFRYERQSTRTACLACWSSSYTPCVYDVLAMMPWSMCKSYCRGAATEGDICVFGRRRIVVPQSAREVHRTFRQYLFTTPHIQRPSSGRTRHFVPCTMENQRTGI